MRPKGRIVVDEGLCKGCRLCVEDCPQKVIELSVDRLSSKGYHPAEMVSQTCTGCGICAIVCPEAAIVVYRERVQKKDIVLEEG